MGDINAKPYIPKGEQEKYIYSPPWAKKCPYCIGRGYQIYYDEQMYQKTENCEYCNKIGYIPIYYTPSQWVEWHRQNGQYDYEIPDDLPVWFKIGNDWHQKLYNQLQFFRSCPVIIATDAGRPPEGWVPE